MTVTVQCMELRESDVKRQRKNVFVVVLMDACGRTCVCVQMLMCVQAHVDAHRGQTQMAIVRLQ